MVSGVSGKSLDLAEILECRPRSRENGNNAAGRAWFWTGVIGVKKGVEAEVKILLLRFRSGRSVGYRKIARSERISAAVVGFLGLTLKRTRDFCYPQNRHFS